MRINQFLAAATPLSRRAADEAILAGQVTVDGAAATIGQTVTAASQVRYLEELVVPATTETIALHKPVDVICSRSHQAPSRTIYDLLPPNLAQLQSIGRLDKDSSGLIILTNDGNLHQRLEHPSQDKLKIYQIQLDRPISPPHVAQLESGVALHDGPSQLLVRKYGGKQLTIGLKEGRNRQIRRTFEALGYRVTKLHRTAIGQVELGNLPVGQWRTLTAEELA